ncbi:MAG TPA: cyclodeaminase/cyclohydrolase family protein [Actinomycetota bacterium]|nr:cyclodeaminase/cyclohydrolase family protein [Actinomycetota bacterium]
MTSTGRPSEGFDFGADSLAAFLERVASDEPAPGGGAAAAVSAALAAGLVAMTARLSSRHLDEPETVMAEADRLRAEALRLATQDAEAYGDVLAAYRLGKDAAGRSARIKLALERATEVPLAIARVGAALASLASLMSTQGNPNLRGDAFVAVVLADAATTGAARLVELNVRLGGLDRQWVDEARDHVAASADAVELAGPPS